MNADNWTRVQEIFDKVSTVPPERRSEVLLAECNGDNVLRDDVASLLHYHDQSDLFLEESRQDDALAVFHNKVVNQLPECIGPYDVKELIDRGGMGSVYIAEQLAPIRRMVALKVVNAGMNREEFLNRFRYELQVLAMVNHPNIAHVFEAGWTKDNRPFFTMEYVPGQTFLIHCDAEKLSIKERLDLFVQVGKGVAHAHKKGVIHRDLKPGNILVTTVDGKPVPKIIDFGIAKIIDQPGGDHATLVGDFYGTPAYMSPEVMSGEEVDTGADVYALGVVLYQLLTGLLPFDDTVYFDRSILNIMEELLVREVPPPEKRVTDIDSETAEMRRTTPGQLARALRGDLSMVIMKALEKDRAHRYQTVEELVDDIQRYLNGYPVEARKHDMGYHTKKFLRRNQKGLVVTGLIAVILSGIGYAKVKEAMVQREAELALSVVVGLVHNTSPFSHDGRMDPKRMVESFSAKLESAEVGKSFPPFFIGEIRRELGRMQLGFRHYQEAATQLLLAIDAYSSSRDARRHEKKTDAILLLTGIRIVNGELIEAESLLDQIDGDMDVPRTDTQKTYQARIWQTRGRLLSVQGDFASAENFYEKAQAALQQLYPEGHPTLTIVLNNRAANYSSMAKPKKALPLYKDALSRRLVELGPNHPDTLITKMNLAWALYKLGEHKAAQEKARETYAAFAEVLGTEHPATLDAANRLGLIDDAVRGNPDEQSVKRFRELWADLQSQLGEDNTKTLQAMNNLANALLSLGKLNEAEHIKAEELVRRERIAPNHPNTFLSKLTLAEIYEAREDYDSALDLYRAIHVGFERLGHQQNLFLAKGYLGSCLSKNGATEEGETLMLESFQFLQSAEPRYASWVKQKLIDHYQALGQQAEAARWRTMDQTNQE